MPWPPPAVAAAPPPAPSWDKDARDALRILVVDDEADIRQSLVQALRTYLKADVVAVSDASQAQALLAGGRCDLVLLDHLLPGIQGSELLPWMAKRRLIARTIMMTALTEGDLASSPLLLAGAAAVLRKPIDLEHLVQTIRQVCPPTSRGA